MDNSPQNMQSNKKYKLLWWIIGIIVLLMIVGVLSNSRNEIITPSTPIENQNESEEQKLNKSENIIYQLSGMGSTISDNYILVKGETNLPDGSILDIKIERISIWQSEEVERFYIVGSGIATVDDNTYESRIEINDRKFLEFEKISGEVIKELNENIEISVVFNPSNDKQPKNVVDEVGIEGQKLDSSPQKKVFGSATPNPINRLDIEFKTKLPFPFINELPK